MKKSLGAATIAHPVPVWVIGTYDREGKPNASTVAWGGICCSRPRQVKTTSLSRGRPPQVQTTISRRQARVQSYRSTNSQITL